MSDKQNHPGSEYQELFAFLQQEHRLILTTSQRVDLIEKVRQLHPIQPPAVKGAVWVNAVDALPMEDMPIIRAISTGTVSGDVVSFEDGYVTYYVGRQKYTVPFHDIQWLDESGESPTAAGDIPYMRKEDYEQISINIDGGMPEAEACFQSGFTAGHDAGYAKGKAAAGDGKEAIDLLNWLKENDISMQGDGTWREWDVGNAVYIPLANNNTQLYDIFKNRNNAETSNKE